MLRLAESLGDNLVLQRAPHAAVVWGFGTPGERVSTHFQGEIFESAVIGADGVWRQSLPPTPASTTPTHLFFRATGSLSNATLSNVLFGDVLLCAGQSNMQHGLRFPTPGFAGARAEMIAASAASSRDIRLFTAGAVVPPCVGQWAAADSSSVCTTPQLELSTTAPQVGDKRCDGSLAMSWRKANVGASCRQPWSVASAAALSRFSALCWLTARRIRDKRARAAPADVHVPLGLVSSSWTATPISAWQPYESMRECNPHARQGGVLYNTMIAPLTVCVFWVSKPSPAGSSASAPCFSLLCFAIAASN